MGDVSMVLETMIIVEEDICAFPCPVECDEGFLVESGSGINCM